MALVTFATIILAIIVAYLISHFFLSFVKLAVGTLFMVFLLILFFGITWKDAIDWGVAILLWIF
ncbi:MAG: hypothetical protein Q8Q01_02490 [archaeon]|nr:hypothetical protein [archaeon]